MCHDVEVFKRFHAAVTPSKDMMIAEGFSSFAVEDFYDSFMEQLNKLGPNDDKSNPNGVEDLTESNCNGVPLDKESSTSELKDKLGKCLIAISKIYSHVTCYHGL